MVFQASEKTVTSQTVGADFSDLERIKRAEEKATQDLAAAERNAERIIADAEKNFALYKTKMMTELKSKLDQEYKFEEQTAKEEAKKIKAQGDTEATQLSDRVRARIPNAVDHIVKSVIG